MAEIKVTTQAVTDEEVTRLFDMVFKDEWPVDAIRIAATVRGLREHAERLRSVVSDLCDYTGELWYSGGLRSGSAHEETVRTIRGLLGGVRDLIDQEGRA